MSTTAAVQPLPAWRRCVSDEGALRAPSDFVSRLDGGEPLGFGGRCSTSDGSEGRRAAVEDLYGAVEAFAFATGIDARPFLPGKSELQSKLKAARAHTSHTVDGRSFRNRYVEIDLRERAGVVFICSVGSGHLLDDQGEQPYVRYVAQAVRRLSAAVLCCSRSTAARARTGAPRP